MTERILVVDDEVAMRRALATNLRVRGYKVDLAVTGEQALDMAARHHPDLVILDLGLPGMDGLEVIRGLRGWTTVPIMILSARGTEPDKVAALDAGADDYLTKPFGTDELLARLRVALRHAARGATDEPVFSTGALRVDLAARQVFVNDQEIHLTPTEYKLLTTLVRNAGKVVTHRLLLKEVWGPNAVEHTHYLRVYMTQLRHKIEGDPTRPRILQTETGVGYRLRME